MYIHVKAKADAEAKAAADADGVQGSEWRRSAVSPEGKSSHVLKRWLYGCMALGGGMGGMMRDAWYLHTRSTLQLYAYIPRCSCRGPCRAPVRHGTMASKQALKPCDLTGW
jgi:hypothetical protein